jgi:hypothetical protein
MSSTNNIRYEIFPQLYEYDTMPAGQFVPYAMLSGPRNYRGQCVNTDNKGFRLTTANGQLISTDSLERYEKVNLIVGGSTVFGVGSSNDENTISSKLSNDTGELWLNIGIRGCNSLQEIIHLNTILYRIKKVDKIVIFSGVNDLYLRIVNDKQLEYDNGFGSKYTSLATYHPYRQSLALLLGSLYGIEAEELVGRKISDMIVWPFAKKKFPSPSYGPMDLSSKLENFINLYRRNFSIYKGIEFSNNCKIHFIFQPLIFWSDKIISDNEYKVLNYLNEVQKNDHWNFVKESLCKEGIKETVLSKLTKVAKGSNISFFDSNKLFNGVKEDSFVDSVHLSDYGNNIISKYIMKIT